MFTACMYLRTDSYIEQIKHFRKQTIEQLNKFKNTDLERLLGSDFLNENYPLEQQKLNLITLSPVIAKAIYSMEFSFIKASGNIIFITSDSPAFLMDRNPSEFYGSGFLTKTIELYMPLTPRLLFLGHWEKGINGYMESKDDVVKGINTNIYLSSINAIISSSSTYHVYHDHIARIIKKPETLTALYEE